MWSFASALILLAFALWIYYRKKWFSWLKELNIPGPEPNLLFGNLLEMSQNPLECHKRWIKKYGKVVGYYLGRYPMVLVSDVNILKRIQITEFNKFINRPVLFRERTPKNDETPGGFRHSLVQSRDKRWKDIRSILTPSFTTAKMKQMAPLMNDAMNSLVNNIEKKCKSGEEFDIYGMFQGLTMDVVGRTAFGIISDVQNNPKDPFLRTARLLFSENIENFIFILRASFESKLVRWINTLVKSSANSGKNPIMELVGLVKGVLAERRKNKESQRPDLLQLLIDSQADNLDSVTSEQLTATDEREVEDTKPETVVGQNDEKSSKKLTDGEVVDNAFIFFLAGYETTSTSLAFVTHLLIKHPEVQEKVRKEVLELLSKENCLDYHAVSQLQYLDQVLKETLRLYPPFYLFASRDCGEDVDFGEFKIKKGVAIQVAVYNLHRDPELWEEPDEFRPERFAPENRGKINPIAYQPFGAGPRNCIGMRFALMEEKLALARILSKYYLQKCSKTETELTLRSRHSSMHPKNGVWLKVTPVQT